VLGTVLLSFGQAIAKDYINESSTVVDSQPSTENRFHFTLEDCSVAIGYDLDVKLTTGHLKLHIFDPDGRKLIEVGAQACTITERIEGTTRPGVYVAEVVATNANGKWSLRIHDNPPERGGHVPRIAKLAPGFAAAKLMILVAVASVVFWRRRTGAWWRWFWVGAAVWAVAVVVKFAIAIPLNGPLYNGLKTILPCWTYFTAIMIYGGVMTGVTEILFTLLAARLYRQMTFSADRAIAVGIGAGAVEAIVLAFITAAATASGGAKVMTWGTAMAPVVERVIAILCHTASRSLVLMSVFKKRRAIFWYGFLLLSGLDAVAALIHLMAPLGITSPWTMEIILVPFGLVSTFVIVWCFHHWSLEPAERVPIKNDK
jgi:hypothetical protein